MKFTLYEVVTHVLILGFVQKVSQTWVLKMLPIHILLLRKSNCYLQFLEVRYEIKLGTKGLFWFLDSVVNFMLPWKPKQRSKINMYVQVSKEEK